MVDSLTIHQEDQSPPLHPRGVSPKTPIDAANEFVPVEGLAERLAGRGVRHGKEVLFRCPLHNDNNPSLSVNPEKGLWRCFPCGVGGDVVRLAQLAWGYPVEESHIAAAELLVMFGHEVPARPSSWFRRQ